MRYVRTSDLTPGMRTTKNLYNNDGICLLAANHVLSNGLINALKAQGTEGIYIFDEYSEYEELHQIVPEEERKNAINSLKSMEIDKVIFFANEIMNSLMKATDIMLDMGDLREYHEDTYEHSVNVCILATTCGIGLGLSNDELKELSAAALLHDIGKTQISKDILDKKGKLTQSERDIINNHTRLGYELLYNNHSISSRIRSGVLSHHENFDGTGYPNNRANYDIPLYARIIRVADVYDAMTQKRAYKDKITPNNVIEHLMSNCGTLFDIDIVRVFMQYLVLYPVGTNIILSDGRSARVIKNRQTYVMRPVVMTKDKEILDLAFDRNTYHLTIKDCEMFYSEIKKESA